MVVTSSQTFNERAGRVFLAATELISEPQETPPKGPYLGRAADDYDAGIGEGELWRR